MATLTSPSPNPVASPLANLYPLGILVVEDDPINRAFLERFLRLLGYTPQLANDGQEAIDTLNAAHFDTVIMDINMPGLDGIEATRRIRAGSAGEDNRQIHIIALTALSFAEDRRRCMEAGADQYITKPVNLDQVREALVAAYRAAS